MAAEYFAATQDVALNQAAAFTASIPCNRGNIFFENGTGVFTLNGRVCGNNRFARYKVTFNGNLSIPEGGTAGPIAVALSVNGEARQSSVAIVTPAADRMSSSRPNPSRLFSAPSIISLTAVSADAGDRAA